MSEALDPLPAQPSSELAPQAAVEEECVGAPERERDLRPRFRMTLAYDGTGFHGWQRQERPDGPALRTVAGEVQVTLQRVLRQPITLVGASRTDTGVHALGQVAHFNADSPIPIERMRRALSSRLPEDIDVVDIGPVDADFDAISGAVSKQYRYRVFTAHRKPLHQRHQVWACPEDLDVERMNVAAGALGGEHDFAAFANANHGRASTVRRIHHCRVHRVGDEVQIVVRGSGFLYHMVRIIAGTLLEVGRGRLDAGVVGRMIETRDRRLGGPTLGPQGLCLEWVRYAGDAELD